MKQKRKSKTCTNLLFFLQLISIRRCGNKDRIFYIEVGRSAVTGGGEFYMETEDSNISKHMYDTIYEAMRNAGTKDEVTPRQRMRSCSANEASKPISVLQRRHTNQKVHTLHGEYALRTPTSYLTTLHALTFTVYTLMS